MRREVREYATYTIGSALRAAMGFFVLPIVLRLVREVSRAVKIPVIGSGGITSADDAKRHLRAGARAVQVGSANLRDPSVMFKIIDELAD